MNIVQLQEQLKNFSQDQLVREMQMPSGTAPQFLVLGEIMRRQKMQQDFAAQQAKGAPQSTVAEDAIAASGVPQQGLASMARSLAPQTDMAQNTGVQAMATGGPVKMAKGGAAKTDPAVIAMANRLGMSVDDYLRSVGEEQAGRIEQSAAARALRERMAGMEPAGEGITMPTQADLDRRFQEQQFAFGASRPLVAPAVEDSAFTPPAMEARVIGRDMTAPGLPGLAAVADTQPRRGRTFTPDQIAVMEAAQPPVAPPMGGVLPPPKPPAGVYVPQYEEGTVFDPVTGVPISGGRVQGEAPAVSIPVDPRIALAEENIRKQLEEQGFTPGELDMEAEAKRSAEEAAAARDAAGITQSLEAPFTLPQEQPTQPATGATASGGTGGTGGTGGGIAGVGGVSSYEQELMNMLQRREKAAEQDKWLALAQVGLNMMSSTQPTLLGAIGEAGVKGVEAARSARDQYDKDRLDLLGAIEQSRMARAAAAAKAARSASSGGLGISAGTGRLLTQVSADITRLDTILNDPMVVTAALTPEQELELAGLKAQRDQLVAYRQQLLYGQPLAPPEDDTMLDAADE